MARVKPSDLVSGEWPDGPTKTSLPMPEFVTTEAMRIFALRLRSKLARDGLTYRQAAEQCGVNFSILSDYLNGNSYVDFVTAFRLEVGLGVRLLPEFNERWPARLRRKEH